jgi:peptide/nickel transport system substrate-binding protein
MRRSWALGLGLWALGLAVAGCSSSGQPAIDDDIVRVIIQAGPTNLDPRAGTDQQSQRVHQLVFDTLMRIADNLQVVPSLADHLENPDPLTYIAHLRSGVMFHDGHELTSRDVVYTFTSLLDPGFVSARKGAYSMVASVTALDERRVEFKLKEPFGSFPINLVMQIVPDGATAEAMRTFPIGTGPYRFVRHTVDEQVDLLAFEGYWDGLPQNAGITLRIVPDETMRALELRKGTADVIINDQAPDVAYALQKDGLKLFEGPGVDYMYLGMNLRDPLLQDKRLRHAIGYAINRQAIVDYLRRGLAEPAVGVLAPVAWAFEPDVHQFEYSVEKAKQLLDEAGYRDPDGDGPQPRLRLTLKTSTDEFVRLQAAVIQEDLRLAGIELDARSYEFATFFADVLSGNVQLYTAQWVGVTDPDMLRRLYHSGQVPPVGFNRTYYRNPEVDRLIDLAGTAPSDAERLQYYREVQKLVAEDAPYIPLWYRTNIAVTRPVITGLRLSPQGAFWTLKDVKKNPPAGFDQPANRGN